MTLAADTRDAVRDHPFLRDALRAGICNYSAAARFLALDGDTDAVVAALRRYAEDLPDYDTDSPSVRVSMQSGLGPTDTDSPLLSVGDTGFGESGDGHTAVLASGDVDATALQSVLARLDIEDVPVVATGFGGDAIVVVVERLDGANAVRAVESALDAVPR
jgi:hypothetical protein